MRKVGIINYGVGNLRSVANALQHVGAQPIVSDDAQKLFACDRIVFPGVGAFAYGMQALQSKGLEKVVINSVADQKPLLAICVGMQLLFERSHEFGITNGLGIIPGEIKKFGADGSQANTLRLPNVNWLKINPCDRADGIAGKLLKDVTDESRFYFVHSYHAQSSNPNTVAISQYNGLNFAAVVGTESVFATQFHPEKSGADGLRMLENFVNE